MSTVSIRLALLGCLLSAGGAAWSAGPLAEGTRMRVLDPSLGTRDWVEGRLKAGADGCMLVVLDSKSRSGHTAVSVAGARQVQVFKDGRWAAAPVQAINAAQPQPCRGGGDNG